MGHFLLDMLGLLIRVILLYTIALPLLLIVATPFILAMPLFEKRPYWTSVRAHYRRATIAILEFFPLELL